MSPYPQWRVVVSVANSDGVESIAVEIDAPDGFAAEQDVTLMLDYDGWEILAVESVEPVGTAV